MNIVFESYSDNLVTSPDEIEKWIDELKIMSKIVKGDGSF
jgi:hypothetical protein